MENLFGGWGVGSTWVDGSGFWRVRTGGQQWIQNNLKVCLSELISICQGIGLKLSFRIYVIYIYMMLVIMVGSSTCIKWKKHRTLTWMKNLIHRGLMYWMKLLWSGFKNMRPDSCVLGVKFTLLVWKTHYLLCFNIRFVYISDIGR